MECLRCPYNRYPRIPATPIPPNSPNSPTIELAIVGEAPGVSEISQKRPFVGASGQLLQRALEACKLPSGNTVFVTNALLCRPPQGVPIKREAVDLYRQSITSDEITKEQFMSVFAGDQDLLISLGVNPDDMPILLDHLLFSIG